MKRYFAFGIIAALALSGCMKEVGPDDIQESITFYATMEDDDTKTSLDSEGNVLWKQGDLVSIFRGNTANEKWKVKDESEGQTSAELKKVAGAKAGDAIANNVACYPYAATNTIAKDGDNYVLGVTLPAVQYYEENSFGNGAFPMVAVTNSTSDYKLKFKNVLGALVLHIKGTAKIISISITGNNGEALCGPASVTVAQGGLPTIAMTGGEESSKTVTLDCGAGVQLNSSTATTFIIALPPMKLTGGITVTITDNAGKKLVYPARTQFEFKRSIKLNYPEFTYRASASVDVTNLAGTDRKIANCYIVPSAGFYKFEAKRGNGETAESVGTVASAEVLWESFGTSTLPSSGDLVNIFNANNNTIIFYATSRKGNAVIAAKDSDGKILWSWHIWLTDQPQNQYYNCKANMLDRNLGATSATPGDVGALGLFYQWGRKDPFLGSSSTSGTTRAASTATWPDYVNTADVLSGTNTLEYATANPMVFIQGSYDIGDWYSATTENMNDGLWASTKTIYDPCPAGYKVPETGGDGAWEMSFGSGFWTTAANWDDTNKGMNFATTDRTLGSDPVIWYPATGVLSADGINNTGLIGTWWSSSTNKDCGRNMGIAYTGTLNASTSSLRRAGRAVRCIEKDWIYIGVTSITLDKTSLSLTAGQTVTLNATLLPYEATFPTITWSSSNESVASVDQDGKVTVLKAGTVTITASSYDGAKKATCQITANSGSTEPASATDLSATATANSYIVSSAGTYKFKTVKGNSSESVGAVSSADVLWESFGTATTPEGDDLVGKATYADGYIAFTASANKGNALIAAKDAEGNVLWSWHIWLTDQPQDQIYNNGAGAVMDRNLGATSTTPGDVHALGLFYQWGRKDPFLTGAAITGKTRAASTGFWSIEYPSDHMTGNNCLPYTIANPTAFMKIGSQYGDWYCTDDSNRNDGLWASTKTVYDPCPAGYRIPDGDVNGLWARASGTIHTFGSTWDSTNLGINFGVTEKTFGSYANIWYPAAGYIISYSYDSSIEVRYNVNGAIGRYWTCGHMIDQYRPAILSIASNSISVPANYGSGGGEYKAAGQSVRCLKEGTTDPIIGVTGVTVNKSSITLAEGETTKLTATVTPDNATNKSIIWRSGSLIAAVDQNGNVTGRSAGSTTIYACSYDGSIKASCSITVAATPIPATGVALDMTSLSVSVGDSADLTAIVSPADATNKGVVWSSSDESVVTVNQSGKVTAVALGQATITATTESGNHAATCSISVIPATIAVTGITLDKTSLLLAVGGSEDLSATISPADATNKDKIWSSSDESVATVDRNGRVTGLGMGQATITVKSWNGQQQATCLVACPKDLSAGGTANCYIVPSAGTYRLKTVKGNSDVSVGEVSSAEVLWETYCDTNAPSIGALVNNVNYSDSSIIFNATGRKGNALIAAKDANGNILWSWHIWLTDQPEDQKYNRGAGTMMDRNLGATSLSTYGYDSFGFLYQWGRKDPFMGILKKSRHQDANLSFYYDRFATTRAMEEPISTSNARGTIEYATAHPTQFITSTSDWYRGTGGDKRWQTTKTIYDPCPPGYRIPDSNLWDTAFGGCSYWEDSNYVGFDYVDFAKTDRTLGLYDHIYYPLCGVISNKDGIVYGLYISGCYWSCSIYSHFHFSQDTKGIDIYYYTSSLAAGKSVRCQKIEE